MNDKDLKTLVDSWVREMYPSSSVRDEKPKESPEKAKTEKETEETSQHIQNIINKWL